MITSDILSEQWQPNTATIICVKTGRKYISLLNCGALKAALESVTQFVGCGIEKVLFWCHSSLLRLLWHCPHDCSACVVHFITLSVLFFWRDNYCLLQSKGSPGKITYSKTFDLFKVFQFISVSRPASPISAHWICFKTLCPGKTFILFILC